jgi:hypothetical protein
MYEKTFWQILKKNLMVDIPPSKLNGILIDLAMSFPIYLFLNLRLESLSIPYAVFGEGAYALTIDLSHMTN